MSEWKNGLPPVGEKCNVYVEVDDTQKGNFYGVEILYQGDEMTVFKLEGVEYAHHHEELTFKPLKSEVELKRERAVEQIADSLLDAGAQDVPESIAAGMYDAGFRKVNELTDEQIDSVKYSTCSKFGECNGETQAYREGMRDARRHILGEDS